MERKNVRHWSIFVAVWSLAALSLLLYLPIFQRTFYLKTPPDKTRPDIYLEFLEADMMWAAMLVMLGVAIIQTFFWRVRSVKDAALPQFAIWTALGAGLWAVNWLKPLPEPLRTTVGEKRYAISRDYLPYLPSPESQMLTLSVCQDSLEPYHERDCERQRFTVRASDGRMFLGAESNLAQYGLREDEGRLENLLQAGVVVEESDGMRLVEVKSESKDYGYWVTIDAQETVRRMVACFPASPCYVSATSPLGELSYRISRDVGGSLQASGQVEDGFVKVLESLAVNTAAGTRNRP